MALTALPLLLLLTQSPSPEDIAKIESEQGKATAEVDKKYGNRKPSEMSNDERKQMMKDKADAERAVLDKHGVDGKDFARTSTKQTKEDRAATNAAAEAIKKKDADAAKSDGKGKEVVIDKGGQKSDQDLAAEQDAKAGYGKGTGGGGKKKHR